MTMEKIEEYKRLTLEYTQLIALHVYHEAESVDYILDRMDEIWYDMSDTEQAEIETWIQTLPR